MTLEDALSFFYNSSTYELISEGVADMHCRSDEYLVDKLMIEYKDILLPLTRRVVRRGVLFP